MISPADSTLITEAIHVSTVVFFSIGGSILVVLAGFWGFSKIIALISDSRDAKFAYATSGSSNARTDRYVKEYGLKSYNEQSKKSIQAVSTIELHSRYIDRYGTKAYKDRFVNSNGKNDWGTDRLLSGDGLSNRKVNGGGYRRIRRTSL